MQLVFSENAFSFVKLKLISDRRWKFSKFLVDLVFLDNAFSFVKNWYQSALKIPEISNRDFSVKLKAFVVHQQDGFVW